MNPPESLHEYVIRQLNENKGRWTAIAKDSGVAKSTLVKIARREVENPGVLHVEKLAVYFRQNSVAA
jgi:DNA invertase Pin-like site-specific DNA recombinase